MKRIVFAVLFSILLLSTTISTGMLTVSASNVASIKEVRKFAEESMIISTGALTVSASNVTDIKVARKWAEENLLPQEGVTGISVSEEPTPRIIVFIENEQYTDTIPQEIMGFKTKVVVTGKIKAL